MIKGQRPGFSQVFYNAKGEKLWIGYVVASAVLTRGPQEREQDFPNQPGVRPG